MSRRQPHPFRFTHRDVQVLCVGVVIACILIGGAFVAALVSLGGVR